MLLEYVEEEGKDERIQHLEIDVHGVQEKVLLEMVNHPRPDIVTITMQRL